MKKKVFAVIGLNRFGSNLAINLQNLGNEVIAIDADEKKVRAVADEITHAAIGDPTDEAVLRTFGVENADVAIVALTEDIQSGVLVTLMLKEMGVKNVIAESTSEIHGRILTRVGADKVIFPERDMGERLAKSLSDSNIMEYIDLSDEYSIMEIRVPAGWAGKTLGHLQVRAKYHINVLAIRSAEGELDLSPDPQKPLNGDGNIVVIGSNKSIEQIIRR